jgi:hypothetical protein
MSGQTLIQKEIEMRELTLEETGLVSGGVGACTPESTGGGNNYGGITDTQSIGDDIVNVYEGLVYAASHIIERVADALSD